MRLSKNIFLAVIAATAAAFAAVPAHAQRAPVYTGTFSNTAVGGYDVTSFYDGTPVRGDASYSTSYNGAEWRFVSAESRDRFLENPTAFAPQYGGYCAWAIAQGQLAKGDPRYYSLIDGKLYLNFNADVQERWLADTAGFIAAADAKWPGILSN